LESLIKQFEEARKMIKMMKKGRVPAAGKAGMEPSRRGRRR